MYLFCSLHIYCIVLVLYYIVGNSMLLTWKRGFLFIFCEKRFEYLDSFEKIKLLLEYIHDFFKGSRDLTLYG